MCVCLSLTLKLKFCPPPHELVKWYRSTSFTLKLLLSWAVGVLTSPICLHEIPYMAQTPPLSSPQSGIELKRPDPQCMSLVVPNIILRYVWIYFIDFPILLFPLFLLLRFLFRCFGRVLKRSRHHGNPMETRRRADCERLNWRVCIDTRRCLPH